MSKADRRAAARLAAAQALYEMEVADKGLADILAEFGRIGSAARSRAISTIRPKSHSSATSSPACRGTNWRSTAGSTTRSPRDGR